MIFDPESQLDVCSKSLHPFAGYKQNKTKQTNTSAKKEIRFIGLACSVFANGPQDLGSVPGRAIPKTLQMVLDTSLLNTQQYKVRIEAKVKQEKQRKE